MGAMKPRIDVSMDAPLVEVALGSGLIAIAGSVVAKRDRSLEEVIRYRMGNELRSKSIMEIFAAKKAMFTCLVDMKKNVATMK